VEGLQPELYWFLAGKHQLVKLKVEPGIADQITQACFNQEFVCKKRCHIHLDRRHVSHDVALRAACVPVRYMHLDAGHVCQNLYLAAESIVAGCYAIRCILRRSDE